MIGAERGWRIRRLGEKEKENRLREYGWRNDWKVEGGTVQEERKTALGRRLEMVGAENG